MITDRLRQALIDQAQTGSTTTSRELAHRLELEPPHTIQQITEALENLMLEDVAAGRPILSALCVSKLHPGVPARGFFLAIAARQGRAVYSGSLHNPRLA